MRDIIFSILAIPVAFTILIVVGITLILSVVALPFIILFDWIDEKLQIKDCY